VVVRSGDVHAMAARAAAASVEDLDGGDDGGDTPSSSVASLHESMEAARTSIGEYILLDRLGRGAYGVVYRGRHRTRGTTAAVKLVRVKKVRPRSPARACAGVLVLVLCVCARACRVCCCCCCRRCRCLWCCWAVARSTTLACVRACVCTLFVSVCLRLRGPPPLLL